MPRTSRVKDNYGVYHVWQHGSGQARLFNGPQDRTDFLAILRQTGAKNNFRILAYCIAEDDEYHLILDANGCDISKVMKEINIRYSIRKDCAGCLFKDRFHSRLLSSRREAPAAGDTTGPDGGAEKLLLGCTDFMKKVDELTVVDGRVFQSGPDTPIEVYGPGCQERISSREEALARLRDQAGALGLTFEEVLKDKPLRNDFLLRMKACSTLSMKDLGQVFGGLSESTVSKLLNTGPAKV